ncbi:MAG: NAD nucleotidase [Campylobacterota bacterium]|nr:NAD nucleotidase [Campylobacterota bacterium]
MKSTLHLFLVTIALFFTSCTQETPLSKNQPTFKTTIIHINDHHSHIDADSIALKVEGEEIKAKIGGFANVVSKIKALQKSVHNPITLHAGDALQGTMYYTLFKGEVDAKVMNQITWDAFTLGNHEFDDGDRELNKFLKALKAPILSANVIASPLSPLYRKWQPYRIITRQGQRIAIIGLDVSFKTKHSSRPSKHISFLDEIKTVQKYVKEIEAMGVNKIILLSHFGFNKDQKLAKVVSGIDVIIDGDSHTLLGEFDMVGLKSQGDYPTLVKSKNSEPICIAQAWQYSYVVGKLHVAFDKDGVISECKGTPTLLLNTTKNPKLIKVASQHPQIEIVQPDTQTTKLISKYQKELKSKKKQIIVTSKAYIGHNRIPNDRADGITALPYGSDIAPLIAKAYYLKSSRANCCIQNAGGVRSGLKKGKISIDDVYKLLPFSNTLIELSMSGKEIKGVLEDALNAVFERGSTGAFPYGYAIRYDIDSTRPKGKRVSNIEILDKTTNKFIPLDMKKEYVVVANSYIAEGRDGYGGFKGVAKRVDTYFDYAMSFSDMIKKDKQVEPLSREYHPIKSFR